MVAHSSNSRHEVALLGWHNALKKARNQNALRQGTHSAVLPPAARLPAVLGSLGCVSCR